MNVYGVRFGTLSKCPWPREVLTDTKWLSRVVGCQKVRKWSWERKMKVRDRSLAETLKEAS